MANFSPKPPINRSKTTSFGSSLDQLKELAKIPGEGFKELFGIGRNQAGNPVSEGEILFDGGEARKQAAIETQEKENQFKIQNLRQELAKMAQEEKVLKQELTEISQTVVQIAKSAQLEAPAGIEKIPVKPGVYHKVFYLRILEEFRKKADEAKEWQNAQQVRVTSKPPRGVLIWLGDQKKVHEAGATFLLQG